MIHVYEQIGGGHICHSDPRIAIGIINNICNSHITPLHEAIQPDIHVEISPDMVTMDSESIGIIGDTHKPHVSAFYNARQPETYVDASPTTVTIDRGAGAVIIKNKRIQPI